MTVEGPAEGDEIQGRAALLLGPRADGAAGLEHAALGAALGQEQAAHQPPQGLIARQLHQHLPGVEGMDVLHRGQREGTTFTFFLSKVTFTRSHTNDGVDHTGRQPARQEQSG